ncbi:family 24 glycosyltransferase, partial [Melampsora larici-populina 98AG31]
SPPISVSIQATWPEPPLLIQIIESAAIERSDSFFPILTAVSKHWRTIDSLSLTPQQIYNQTLNQITLNGLLNDQGEIESLETSIALKEASPKIEAFRAWYRDRPAPRILSFDHICPPGSHIPPPSVPVVILYASNDPRSFGPFHDVLHQASSSSPIRATYIFRWQVSSDDSQSSSIGPSHLSGWATRLDIKKSDYLTVDDRPVETNSRESRDSESESTKENTKEDAPETSTVIIPLQADEFSTIGLKATQHILTSPNPLSALRVLSEDFPRHAYNLVKNWVPGEINADLDRELKENAAEGVVKPGQSAIWINGLDISSVLPVANINFFKLIQLMRDERRWIKSLTSLGLSVSEIRKLVTDEQLNSALSGEGGARSDDLEIDPSILGERFDASDRLEHGEMILWLNDLEKDTRYAAWPKSLRDFLRPTYPGQLHAVARNTITVVLALNVTHTANLRILTESVETFITRSVPIRWGLVPLDDPNASGSSEALKGIFPIYSSGTSTGSTSSDMVDALDFKQRADAYRAAHPESDSDDQKDTASFGEGDFNSWSEKTQSYIRRLALCSGSGEVPGCMFVNGKFFVLDDDFRMNLQQTAMLHIQFLQHQIYYGLIQGSVDVSHYLYDLPGVYPARNEFVFPSPGRPVRVVNLVQAFVAAKLGSCAVEADHETNEPPISAIWVIGNLDSKSGAASVLALLELMVNTDMCFPLLEQCGDMLHLTFTLQAFPSDQTRGSVFVGFVHASSQQTDAHIDPRLSDSLGQLIHSPEHPGILIKNVTDQFAHFGLQPSKPFPESFSLSKMPSEWRRSTEDGEDVWAGAQSLITELDITEGHVAVVINGRVLDVPHSQVLQASDLRMLIDYEIQKRTNPLQVALRSVLGPERFTTIKSMVPYIASVISSVLVSSDDEAGSKTRGRAVSNALTERKHSSISYGDHDAAVIQFRVILNPASELAQSWSALLETLSGRKDVAIKVWFNPMQHVEELPIKRFLRTSFHSRIQFDQDGSSVSPSVVFKHMPTDVLLTLSIEAPPAWLALPLESVHDLDNIMLSKIGSTERERGVEGVFQLEHIIIAGHASELPSEVPPRGLQVVLTNLLTSASVDTIIMANLGYFQFKAEPGMFVMKIRPGRSSELYTLERVDLKTGKDRLSTDKNKTDEDHQFSLTTFDGLLLFPRFRKRPGKEKEKLIQPVAAMSESEDAHTSTTQKLIGHKPSDVIPGKKRNVINVFTVASGLLYERMAYLMCVSVMRHTKSDVKFWFISNFLSPSFKRFIPHLARKYEFEYELVTYRWPPWLRAQKEKQRVIWGYKILFLDVLFPLELDRVIFVDSDQIVRTDLQELVDLDLRGAPYAYTPMCNDREETKGFRFWDTGYWKDSLRGRPYHISALYVVDLRVFRAVAAGDQLRQHYQALSADPNSLANLDQDLPNNMQEVLPIYSLDQKWLWCETWCSDDGLKTAKTIDLCNNPLTHEPKLTRARRLIPEWDVYDKEVA